MSVLKEAFLAGYMHKSAKFVPVELPAGLGRKPGTPPPPPSAKFLAESAGKGPKETKPVAKAVGELTQTQMDPKAKPSADIVKGQKEMNAAANAQAKRTADNLRKAQ